MAIGDENAGYEQAASDGLADPSVSSGEQPANSDAAGTQPDASQAASNTSTWNPEEWAINVNGQKVLPKSRENILQWANQGYGYSQKAAELNKQRQELEAQKGQYAQYSQLNEAFEKNPSFRNKIIELYQQSQQGTATPQQQAQVGQLPPEIMQKLQRVDSLESEFQAIKEEKEDKLLDQEIQSLQSKFKDEPWNVDAGQGTLLFQVLKKAQETGLTNLEDVYKMIRFDHVRANTEAATRKQLADQQAENARKGVVASPTSQKPSAPQFNPKTPWNKLDAAEMLASVSQQ
jgi:hypothetical protein